MIINGGGYTFLPWSSLSASSTLLSSIYNDKTQVLFRLISRSNSAYQPYILTTQLSMYSGIPISIFENSSPGFNSPVNIGLGNHIYIGFLSVAQIYPGIVQGFTANGQNIAFVNCDGNPNSYFSLFANLNPTSTSGYSVGNGLFDPWINSAISHPYGTYMPSSYFYFTEMHQGGYEFFEIRLYQLTL